MDNRGVFYEWGSIYLFYMSSNKRGLNGFLIFKFLFFGIFFYLFDVIIEMMLG